MEDWRTYKITSKDTKSNCILFYLGNYVNYRNGSYNYKHIYCSNSNPFHNWREGDFIEIDNDVSRNRESGHYFGNTGEARINCSNVCGHSHGEYDDMKDKCDALEVERDDLRADRDSWRKKRDEIKDQLNNEKFESANKLAEEKLKSQNTELTLINEIKLEKEKTKNLETKSAGLSKQVEDITKELNLVRAEKDKKDNELKELEKKMKTLQVDNEKVIIEKDNFLKEISDESKRKEQEIKKLQGEKFRNEWDLLNRRLSLEKGDLEVFASNLGIDLEEIYNLTENYEKLFFARKEHNRSVVKDSEGKIAKTKQSLLNSEINIDNIQKISRECERLAELSWSLEQVPQQYEAKQEIPPC